MAERHRGEPMRCPACGTRLVEVERSDVLVDACPECRGVWLDRGELDRLLERERRAMLPSDDHVDEDFFAEAEGRRRPPAGPGRTPAPVRRRDDDDDDGRYDDRPGKRKKKRRGILEDLLDFDF